jgi:phospholipid/cholesterol/gamma-HCH transport system substrate-binding protein
MSTERSAGTERRSPSAPLIKLGAFGAVSLFLTVFLGMAYGNFTLTPKNTYRAIFSDVTGSMVGDEVKIAGVPAGRIEKIRLVQNRLAEVTFSVERNWPLMRSSRAEMRYRNLIGQRYLAITEGPGGNQRLRPGGTIPLSQTQPAVNLSVIFNNFKPVFTALSPDDANRLVTTLVRVIQGEGGTIGSLLTQTSSLTTALLGRGQATARAVDNINALLATVDARGKQVGDMVTNLQQLTTSFAQERNTIGTVLVRLNDVVGVTSDLLTNGRSSITGILTELGPLTQTLVNNQDQLETLLTNMPAKLDPLVRPFSYGSFANTRLCELTITSDLLPIAIPTIQLPSRGCERR